jgi:hypothetical protein
MKRAFIVAACVLLGACSEDAPQVSEVSVPCTDNGRACLAETAMTYIDALWAGDGSVARLHPDARRTHAGGTSADEGAAVIAGKVNTETLKDRKNMRLVIDEQKGDVFAFWIVQGDVPNAGHVAERVRVKDGLITEIEVFVVMDAHHIDEIENPWPDESGDAPGAHGCAAPVRACLYEAAGTYLDALMIADGSAVMFAPDVRRTQNGRNIQEGEEALRASVARERLAFKRNFRLFADEHSGQVMALWLTGTNRPPDNVSTAHVIERLRIEDGLISEIEVFYPLEQGTLDGTSGWPDEAP